MAGQGQPYPERTEQGTVEAQNDRGIKVGGSWYDFGNFYEGERPGVGQEVELVARGRFIRSLKIDGVEAGGSAPRGGGGPAAGFGSPPASPRGGGPPPWEDSFAGIDAPPVAGAPGASGRSLRPAAPAGRALAASRAVLTPEERAQDRRERRRLACLQAAAQFFTPRAAATIDDVIDATRVLELFVAEPLEASVSPTEPEDVDPTDLDGAGVAGGDETPL
jgi:hypothetical protein